MIIEKILTTIDTHTAGGPTRTIIGGIPPLAGKSVAEKMNRFRSDFDAIRKLLMCEPRGHRDMSGAVLTEPTHPDADIGAFFITASGYLPACVHSSIGLATAGLETGFIQQEGLQTKGSIKMEIPAGLISLLPTYNGKKVQSIAIQTAPAFVHTPMAEIKMGTGQPLQVSIVFSGVFFVLLDVNRLNAIKGIPDAISTQNAKDLAALGAEIPEVANRTLEVRHPDNPGVNTVELVMIYEELEGRYARDIVINRTGGIDRSPCGAGTGAKVTHLFSEGRLAANEDYVLESFIGTQFVGRVKQPAKVASYDGAIPEIQGSAYVTGMHQFVLERDDPLSEGFLI